MTWKLLMATLVCGAVWFADSGAVSAHDDEWREDGIGVSGAPDLDVLDLYGEWLWEPTHGRVWHPRVGPEWRPFWRGHWVWRGAWTWVSADPWGDVPFHYGEWVWSAGLGWVWIPGTVWAPAHVTWVIVGPVIAWAPPSVHITIGPDPRFWVSADVGAFSRHGVVRPHRVPPSHVHVRRDGATGEIGRVFVPEPEPQPLRREFRITAPGRRSADAGSEQRAVLERSVSGFKGPVRVDQSRTAAHGPRSGRGFEFRNAR